MLGLMPMVVEVIAEKLLKEESTVIELRPVLKNVSRPRDVIVFGKNMVVTLLNENAVASILCKMLLFATVTLERLLHSANADLPMEDIEEMRAMFCKVRALEKQAELICEIVEL